MSNPQGGPQRGAYGPGQTVFDPGVADEALAATQGSGRGAQPPATVRDPSIAFAPAYAPPASYGTRPIAIPPPPPGRGRGRRNKSSSLVAVGVVSFFVIGGTATTLAVLKSPGDDKPAPTVDAPPPATVARDPGASPAPGPADAPSPGATTTRRIGPRLPAGARPPGPRPGHPRPARNPAFTPKPSNPGPPRQQGF